MHSRDDVTKFIIERVRSRSPKARAADLDLHKSVVSAGFVDSFSFLELVTEVEAHFGVQLDLGDHEFEEVSTVDGLCAAVLAGK